MMAKNSKNTGNVGFEEQLWQAAGILWGNMAPSLYQNIVLGLVFLKYISDRFDAKYNELKAEGYGDEEDKDEYLASGIFFVPQIARWSYIQQFVGKEEIGHKIDEGMAAIEKEYPKLKGVLPMDYSNPNWDKQRLGEVINKFSNILMDVDENDRDVLGRTYEYFLTRFSKLAGKGGEFYLSP